MPRHLQGKTRLPLLGGCFSKGHRLALLAVMPIIEAHPGERHEGEAAKLALFQQLLLDGGQPAALRSSRRGLTDAGVDKANELLDQHLFSRALDAIVATKQTD